MEIYMFSEIFKLMMIGLFLFLYAFFLEKKNFEGLSISSFVSGIIISIGSIVFWLVASIAEDCTVQYIDQFIPCVLNLIKIAPCFISCAIIVDVIILISKYINFSKTTNKAVKITFRQFMDFINVDTENTWEYDVESAYKTIIIEKSGISWYNRSEIIYITFSFVDYIKYRIFLYMEKKEKNKKKEIKENDEYNERAIRLLKSVQSDIEVFASKEVAL